MTAIHQAKAGITRDDIHTVVTEFYSRIRAEPRLGPIFEKHIGISDSDWAPHLNKIRDFWANVMLRDRAYQGNPMQAHMAVPEIQGTDFAIWLDLFQSTVTDSLPPAKAQVFDILARRIGKSLRMGLEQARPDGPPAFAEFQAQTGQQPPDQGLSKDP